MPKKKNNMSHLYDVFDSKEHILIKVYQNEKETKAIVLNTCRDKIFIGKAIRSDYDEFNSSVGARLAIARAKKEYLLNEVESFKNIIKRASYKINDKLEKIEFLDKKYGLNREARDNPFYKGKKASFNITKK